MADVMLRRIANMDALTGNPKRWQPASKSADQKFRRCSNHKTMFVSVDARYHLMVGVEPECLYSPTFQLRFKLMISFGVCAMVSKRKAGSATADKGYVSASVSLKHSR